MVVHSQGPTEVHSQDSAALFAADKNAELQKIND
jgi:hypothetical protein